MAHLKSFHSNQRAIRIEFTKEELYLIERTMDNLVSEHLKGVMQYIHTIEHLEGDTKKEGQKFIQNELKQWVETHNTLKTICAKCEELRKVSHSSGTI